VWCLDLNGIRIQIIIQTIYLKLFAKANNYLGLNLIRGSPSAAPQPFFPLTGCTPTFSAHSPPTGPPSRPSQPAGHSPSSSDPQAPPVSGACGSFFLLLPYTLMHASHCARGATGTHGASDARLGGNCPLCPCTAPPNPRGGPQDADHVAAMAWTPWMAAGQNCPCAVSAAAP
jgi:hypothetical protein